MTKKDYIRIAAALKLSHPGGIWDVPPTTDQLYRRIVQAVGDELSRDNPVSTARGFVRHAGYESRATA